MKTLLRKYFYVLFFCSLFILPTLTYSQDWKGDLLAMNTAYSNAKSFKMNVEIKSFATINDFNPLLDYKGSVASSNGNYYTSIMGRITLYNKHCILVVDNQQKMILYKKNKGEVKPQSGFSIAKLDSALIFMGKNVTVTYLVNSEKEKRIQIIYKNSSIDKFELSINPINNSIMQLVYYYNTTKPEFNNSAAKVIVDYTNVEINKSIPDSYFSENKFISIKKDKITPINNYSKYQFVNQNEVQTP